MTSFLDQLEAIRPDGVDAFAVDLDPEWNCPLIPQGGIGAAVAIECMQRILDDPRQRLRSAQVVFAAPVASGPCSVSVVVLRRGRNVSQLQATVTSDGSSAGMTVLAVFGADHVYRRLHVVAGHGGPPARPDSLPFLGSARRTKRVWRPFSSARPSAYIQPRNLVSV